MVVEMLWYVVRVRLKVGLYSAIQQRWISQWGSPGLPNPQVRRPATTDKDRIGRGSPSVI